MLTRLKAWSVWKDLRHHLDDSFHVRPLAVTPVRVLRSVLAPEFQVVARYRLLNAVHRAGFTRAAAFLDLVTKRGLGVELAPQAKIGGGLRIVHAHDIVVGPAVTLGQDVVLFNGVTLGNRLGRAGTEGMPVVGDRVLLGTGAKLLGAITVGDDARVGANAVVLESVPSSAVAVGNPAKSRMRVDNATAGPNGHRKD